MAALSRLFPGAFMACTLAAAAMAQVNPPNVVTTPNDLDRPPPPPMRERVPAVLDKSGNVPLLPRALIFGNPDKVGARISPDGKKIAFLAPLNGVMNIWVGPAKDISQAKAVTSDTKRGIQTFRWAYNSEQVLYVQDKGGDENWHVYSVSAEGGAPRDLTPFEKTQARIAQVSEKFPNEIIVALNNRVPMFHDLHRLDLRTGEMKELLRNEIKTDDGRPDGYADIVVDDDYRVRLASRVNKDGSVSIYKAIEGGKSGFDSIFTVPMEDANLFEFAGFNKDNSKAYVVDSRGRNTAALYEMDPNTGAKSLIFEDDRSDVRQSMINPVTKRVEGVETEYERRVWSIMDMSLQPDLIAIRRAAGMGDIDFTSRSLDDSVWTFVLAYDEGSQETWLLERGDLKDPKRKPVATRLFLARQALADRQLAPMHPVVIKSRDGMELISYLSLPLSADPAKTGRPDKPVPMVLLVHGGPWARDSWGYNTFHQWLSNRGYAVLSVNFRSSTGIGKKFLNAGNKEWAGKMHDDLLDAVGWAIENKIADPAKVAIMGGSYGGYATLVGLTFTPDTFACGVDIVGPSNLATLLNSIPAYWGPALDLMTKQVGDHRTEDGRKFLESKSPLTHVDKIKKPLLIGQGANDPRVKQAESDQIVAAMQKKNIPVTYVLYPDEGHGFVRPENRMSFFAIAEQFLAQHLGGRAEPIGSDLNGSSIQIPTGAEQIPGVSEAMASVSGKAPQRRSAPMNQ